MDWINILATAITGFAATATTLAGAYFWIRRGNQKLMVEAKNDEYTDDKRKDDDAIKRWQDFAEYQQKIFRQKNEEQDARIAGMQSATDARQEVLFKKLDDMHHAHLKCERDGQEREMQLKREATERDLELKQHQRKIDDLQTDLSNVKQELALLSTKVTPNKD